MFKKWLIVVLVLLVILLGSIGFLVYQNYKYQQVAKTSKASPSSDVIPTQPSGQLQVISGSVTAYRIDDKNGEMIATFELEAQSTEGNIKEILVWTDVKTNNTWQPFQKFIELPAQNLDYIYVKFKDEKGNVSEVYSDSIYPHQPGKLAE